MAIAIFDFDGTIISRDSLPDFLIQACGRKAFLLRLPWIILLKGAALTGILSTHRAKELVISSFLRGMKTEDFQQACLEYASRIPAFVYPAALEEIRRHQEEGNKIAIISASVPDWIRPWAQTVGIRLVEGTGLEVREQTLTGRFSTPNCKGGEKVAGSAGYIRISPPRRCMYMATVPATKNCSPLQMSPIINHSTINKHIL